MSARGLGRGFESLIPTDVIDAAFDPTASEDAKSSKLHELKLADVVPDEDQPRRDFDEKQLEALASSIREHGVLQPILVTKEGNKYKIIAGERRWRAAKLAGLEKIPAIIRTMEAQNRLEISLIENVQREDLNAIETATAYMKLKEQFNMSVSDVAKRLGKSESSVVNTMRLLRLPDKVKHSMIEHGLTEGQMRPLIKADEKTIDYVLPKIINENWSARKVEQFMVEQKRKDEAKKLASTVVKDEQAQSTAHANRLSSHLGVKVKVRTNARGSGDIVLKFNNEKEFEKLCSILTA